MTAQFYDGGNAYSDFSTTETGEIDYSLPLGKVRLLITDVATNPADRLFTDEQLDVFLDLGRNVVKRAAAQALLTIALSETLLGKKVRMQNGTSTDGPAVSAELRALAGRLTREADLEEADAEGSVFEIVPSGQTHAEGAEWGWRL